MRTLKFIIALFMGITVNHFAQTGSINNTLGTGGSFNVKDGSNNFFRIDQSTGNSFFFKNIELGNVGNSTANIGVITKNGNRFLHNFAPNGSEENNLFIGLNAGNFTMGGGQYTWSSSYNIGIGSSSLGALTTGTSNTAIGCRSLFSNNDGSNNTAIGYGSLYNNIDGSFNVAVGNYTIFSYGGSRNTAVGYQALYNGAGYSNTAVGCSTLFSSYSGDWNTAVGENALISCQGDNNTAIGYNAGSLITTGYNNICIGSYAEVPSNTSANQVRIGNTLISYAGIQVAWTITSDRRWKENIQPTNLGLQFISKLNPVSYVRKNDEKQKVEYGLIAQELEVVLKEEGVENAGMLTITDEGYYELRYNDLIAPMIKAIKELKDENERLKSELENLTALKKQLAEIMQLKEELVQQIRAQNPYSTKENSILSALEN
uniref:Peptidase S74 domain-containing protein n=1 Tax=Ignavibacterium album TaxID=591197 RepID=A0A832G865_9BACT